MTHVYTPTRPRLSSRPHLAQRGANPKAVQHQKAGGSIRPQHPARKPSYAAQGPTLARLLAPHIHDGYSPTRLVRRQLVERYGEATPDQLTPRHTAAICEAWRHLAPATRHNYHSALRTALRLVRAPVDCDLGIPAAPAVRPRTKRVAPEEAEAVAAISPPWVRWCIWLAWDCALRAGTCTEVKPGDISGQYLRRTTKRGAATNLPLTPRLIALAEAARHIATPGQTVTQALGQRQTSPELRYWSLRKYLIRTQKRLDLPSRWTMHDLRRSAAHDLYDRTADLRKVQALLTHAALSHTAWYLHAEHTELQPADMRPNPTPSTFPTTKESETT